MLDWSFEPLDGKYPRELTGDDDRSRSPFKRTWPGVLNKLENETDWLDCRDGSVVIATAHKRHEVRNDGKLRGDARTPEHPGVVVKFDVPSEDRMKWVPMSFECDQFATWQANVAAIAGALEALRKIDRYGVSSRGKTNAHYEGYKALPSAEGKLTTIQEHAAFISQYSGIETKEIIESPTARKVAFRKAAAALHPDNKQTGSHELFSRLGEANVALEQNQG